MNWPPIKGSYRIINREGDVAVVTRASFNLQDADEFGDCRRICIIGSCVTENVGIDRMIKNIVTNGHIRYLIICGEESRGHNVGDALLKLIKNGVKEGKIIGASGDDPSLRAGEDMIKRFREQIAGIKLIESENPADIISVIKTLPELPALEDFKIKLEESKEHKSNAINADGTKINLVLDKAGMFRIKVKGNRIIATHYMDGKEHAVIEGSKAVDIYKKILQLGLVSDLQHAFYLGSELRKAEMCLRETRDYREDTEEIRPKFRTTFIEARNLSDAWIKALTQVYLHGEEYRVGKYNAKTLDLPLMIYIKNALDEPLIHPKAPKFESREKYTNEFLHGKGEKENEFVYTYYSRLFHYNESLLRSRAPNIRDNDLKGEDTIIQFNQIDAAISLLKKDPTLRRVVISTWMPYKDLSLERSPHAPCLVMIQPRIYNGRLHFYVVFKSQDLYSAFPSNTYALVNLQKKMADELGVKAGSYTHFSISMHIYDNILDNVVNLLKEEEMI